MTTLPALRIPPGTRLPDTDQWVNRFEVRSATSDRLYVIAQNRKKRHWACSCPGWRRHRTCTHLKHLALPAYEKPFEVLLSEWQL